MVDGTDYTGEVYLRSSNYLGKLSDIGIEAVYEVSAMKGSSAVYELISDGTINGTGMYMIKLVALTVMDGYEEIWDQSMLDGITVNHLSFNIGN